MAGLLVVDQLIFQELLFLHPSPWNEYRTEILKMGLICKSGGNSSEEAFKLILFNTLGGPNFLDFSSNLSHLKFTNTTSSTSKCSTL
jgi:hypothetical protein